MNTRRNLLLALTLGALGLGALGTALPSFGQQQKRQQHKKAQEPGKVWRIGFLAARSRPAASGIDYYGAFVKGMVEMGYVEGKHFVMEWRYADGKPERLPALAAELVALDVDVIVTGGARGIRAAQQASKSIPIVMGASLDPLGRGFVSSMARPGGNITGTANVTGDDGPRLLDILGAAVPNVSLVVLLLNPSNESYSATLKSVHAAAREAGVKVLRIEARNPAEIERAFTAMSRQGAGAVLVTVDALFIQQRHQIAALALKNRLPSIYSVGEHVDAGGLLSYGHNRAEIYRRAATYVDRILKGARPGDLPVEPITRVELVINMKTAKALDIAMPPSLLKRADRVIE